MDSDTEPDVFEPLCLWQTLWRWGRTGNDVFLDRVASGNGAAFLIEKETA